MFWSMQGVALWGLALSITSLVQCGAELRTASQQEPDPEKMKNQPNIYNVDVLKGLTSVLDLSISHPLEKPFKDTLDDILSNAITVERGPFFPKMNKLSLQYKNKTAERSLRHKRSTGFLNIPIPILHPLYEGPDDRPDLCERDEIAHYKDGECHQILSQGPCDDNELFLVNQANNKGYCAPRLCNPDRVFVFGDQQCHDPLENDICPPGRILFTSSFGTPVCGCPYGTYEEDDDTDEDVCKPVLSKLEDDCPIGEVYWFRTFKSEPECVRDPCRGLNTNRSKDELPFIPSVFDGKCYQLGEELIQCPDDTFYTLSYQNLGGICASIEDAGYTVLDDDMLEEFALLFGSRLPRDLLLRRASPPLKPFSAPDLSDSSSRFNSVSNHIVPFRIGMSVTAPRFSTKSTFKNSDVLLTPTHTTAFSPATISLEGHTDMARFYRQYLGLTTSHEEDEHENSHSRKKRDDSSFSRFRIPYASPATVFEPTFSACRAGSSIGINSKCNLKYLPARLPRSRPKRNIPPISPFPSCTKGQVYTIRRKCVSNSNKVRSSLIAAGLG